MRIAFRRWLPLGLLGGASAWIVSSNTSSGDWPGDAAPAVQALAHGHLSAYLSAHPIMGPFATLVQAPFAALAGGGGLAEYQWASFPCVLAAGLLGLYLAHVAHRRGATGLTRALLAVLCLVNPLTFEALRTGHPEEILTAALAVAAVAVAAEGHHRRAALLLGLAIASKQWAVIAIFPVLMALPSRRVRAGAGAAAVVVVLTLPGLLAAPGSFGSVQSNAASGGHIASIWSVWYPTATVTDRRLTTGTTHLTAFVHETPSLVGTLSHPLIVALAVLLPLALVARRRRFDLSGHEAMALLALLALLRCALDPVGNLYYHAPLLLALIGWDAFAVPRALPLRALLGAAVAELFWKWSVDVTASGLQEFNAAYVCVAVAAAFAIGISLFRNSGSGATIGRSLFDGIPGSAEPVS